MSPPAPDALRVALVIGHLGHGGAERQLAELALRLEPVGVRPVVFCLGGIEEPWGRLLRHRGIPVESIPRRSSFDLRRIFALSRRLREGSFDIVHSFLANANPYAWLAARIAGAGAFVASSRNADYPRDPLRAAIDALAFRRADAVVANAAAVREFTARRFGIPAARIDVVYNGVDVDRFHPLERAPNASPVVGTVGSLTPKKNPELFATVAGTVRDRAPAVRFLHLGDGPLRAELEARHGAAVRYLGASEDAAAFLAGLDVFVLTSDHEGCPNALLEAMACGRVSVATAVGGVREIIENGASGYVVERGDRGGLVGHVVRLLGDSALRERLGAAARERVSTRFTLPTMVEGMVAVYQRCLRGERA